MSIPLSIQDNLSRLRQIIILPLLFLLTGCNSEVFVDKLEISSPHLNLKADGDSATIHVSSANWMIARIHLDIPDFDKSKYKLYDIMGNPIYNQNSLEYLCFGDKGTITLETDQISLSIKRHHDKQFQVIVNENLMNIDFNFQINLADIYSDNTVLKVTQPAAESYLFDTIIYTIRPDSYYTSSESKLYLCVTNTTSEKLPLHVPVFNDENQKIRFSSNNPRAFSFLKEMIREVPYPQMWHNGQPQLSNHRIYFTSSEQKCPLPFNDITKTIYIPQGATRYIYRLLNYEEYQADFSLYVKNKKSGVRKCIEGVFHCITPTDQYYILQAVTPFNHLN